MIDHCAQCMHYKIYIWKGYNCPGELVQRYSVVNRQRKESVREKRRQLRILRVFDCSYLSALNKKLLEMSSPSRKRLGYSTDII